MYVCDVWIHINAYVNKTERQFLEDFYNSRRIAHTIHLHTDVKRHTTNIELFMPNPYQKIEGIKVIDKADELRKEWERNRAKTLKSNE